MSDVFPTAPPATVTRLARDAVPAEIVDRLQAGAIVASAEVGVIDLTGAAGEGEGREGGGQSPASKAC